jgi:hypothetical protein
MECPACGTEVTLGLHECEECHSDLTHLDEKQKTALQKSILKNTIEMVEPSPPLVLPEESSLLHAIQLLQAIRPVV